MTGTERKRLWRQRQAEANVQVQQPGTRIDLMQDWRDREKTLRAVVRLRHAKAADREIGLLVKEESTRYWKDVQLGRTPAPLDLQKLAGS